ncbi:hypothetical protein PSCLAVI8L_90112 [Pseudoclavibacter sp. 8L]|nr:hypothetical protein PSCLAVI8L_90112 [Pseudoclavibacter sp. 8L]
MVGWTSSSWYFRVRDDSSVLLRASQDARAIGHNTPNRGGYHWGIPTRGTPSEVCGQP